MDALERAVTCAILARAGPHRTRILSMLYKDERCVFDLQRASKILKYVCRCRKLLRVFPMLEKMYMGRLLRTPEISAYSKTLRPHQLATTMDGLTVSRRSCRWFH